MARLAVKTEFGVPFTQLTVVNSTNIYAMEQIQSNLAEHGAAFFALKQTAGKGQMGKGWIATPGENVLLSVVINPMPLSLRQQFPLSAMVALACYDTLHQYIPEELSIKWPNDLYWGDRKTGGILIENLVSGNNWNWAIAGMGININQTAFPSVGIKAVSLKQITGKEYDPIIIAKQLCAFLTTRFVQLQIDGIEAIMDDYSAHLYKRNQLVKLKKDNIIGSYTIKSVTNNGELIAEAGIEHQFTHGSVEWVIPH